MIVHEVRTHSGYDRRGKFNEEVGESRIILDTSLSGTQLQFSFMYDNQLLLENNICNFKTIIVPPEQLIRVEELGEFSEAAE